jgi:hypothetical protein
VVRREALRRIPGVAGKARVDTGHLQIVIDRPTGKPIADSVRRMISLAGAKAPSQNIRF